MNREQQISIDDGAIRREWDKNTNKWYFSIVDVIKIVTESSDPRNYWKVLKNRLNKVNKELVTNCNQLKMPSADGKSYLTDTADSETMLEIIKIISIAYVIPFRLWFEKIELAEDSGGDDSEAELMLDAWQTDTYICIESIIAGVALENISVSVNTNEVKIVGKRLTREGVIENNYSLKELFWGTFSRTIPLPSEVDIDEVEATISHGLLKIKLQKVDKARIRKIKIKSLD